jgi:hypothetical protein
MYRTLSCLLGYLLVGSAATVVVAWAGTWFSSGLGVGNGGVWDSSRTGAPLEDSSHFANESDPLTTYRVFPFVTLWSSSVVWIGGSEERPAVLEGVLAGLPLRALRNSRVGFVSGNSPPVEQMRAASAAENTVLRSGIVVSESRADPLGSLPLRLPVAPIWSGLLVDSIFWGALAFGAVRGLRVIRRRSRVRRGLCGLCGHHLRGVAPCPECGGNSQITG